MKIGLLGYGKMGQLIEVLGAAQGDAVVARMQRHTEWNEECLERFQQADILIDFSEGASVLKHAELSIKLQKDLIIGTTGWEKDFFEVKNKIEHSNIGCLFSPNFSLGVLIFHEIVRKAAQLMYRYGGYAVGGVEYHRANKQDAPSGTAKALQELVKGEMPDSPQFEFSSVRCGNIPGTHTLLFSSTSDTITLTHEAHHQEGFARGALLAAKWLIGKKGFFTLADLLTIQETH